MSASRLPTTSKHTCLTWSNPALTQWTFAAKLRSRCSGIRIKSIQSQCCRYSLTISSVLSVEASLTMSQMAVRVQERQGDWVVNPRADAIGFQIPQQGVAAPSRHADHIQMIDRLHIVDLTGGDDSCALQRFMVPTGIPAAALGPIVKVAQLGVEHGGLNPVKTAVHALHRMVVPIRAAMVGEHRIPPGPGLVIRHQRAAVTIRAQVLPGIETEACDIGQRGHRLALVQRAVSLSRITDDEEAML